MVFDTLFLKDGTRAVIRRALPDDLIQIDEMHRRLSAESLYLRYLRPYRPTLADARRICQIEEDKGGGLVAAVEGTGARSQKAVIGVAHYAIETSRNQIPRTAEPAVLVEDRYQGQGVGRLLFRVLGQCAHAQGIYEFHAFVHPSNERMMQTIRRSGYPFQMRVRSSVQEVCILLLPGRSNAGLPSRQLLSAESAFSAGV